MKVNICATIRSCQIWSQIWWDGVWENESDEVNHRHHTGYRVVPQDYAHKLNWFEPSLMEFSLCMQYTE